MPPLKNTRQERFAQELAKGMSASQAYKLAGYAENRGNASTLKSNKNVQTRIGELIGEAAAKTVVTVETLVANLLEDRALAQQYKQIGAAVSANQTIGKLLGLMPDRTELTGARGGPVQYEDTGAGDALASKIAEVSQRLNVSNDDTPADKPRLKAVR